MNDTNMQYDAVINTCKQIFINKTEDYGTAWRVLRIISVADQIFIKALRIKTIQENKLQKIEDTINSEFKGIINYAIIGIIQLKLDEPSVEDEAAERASMWYDEAAAEAKNLMIDKNHDYGEAWRQMSPESFVDLILMKLLRIKQILSNDGRTIMSEGIDANFIDIINYAIFALILNEENENN